MYRLRKWMGYLLLLTGTVCLGFLSGALYPMTSGIRGAAIGGISSLGIIMLDELERDRLANSKYPRWRMVFGVALVTGCIAGLALLLWGANEDVSQRLFETLNFRTAWPILGLTISYCLVLHLTYAIRRISTWLLVPIPWIIGAAGVGLYVLWDLNQHNFGDPASSVLLSLFAALPLFLGWGFTVAMFDPAFTLERWRRTLPPDEQSVK